jgi:hypothetical protein
MKNRGPAGPDKRGLAPASWRAREERAVLDSRL